MRNTISEVTVKQNGGKRWQEKRGDRTNGTQVRNAEVTAVNFAHITACNAVQWLNRKSDAALNYEDFSLIYKHVAELSAYTKCAVLGNNEHVAIGVVECLVDHRAIARVLINSHTGLHSGISSTGDGIHALNEIDGIWTRNE